MKKTEYLEGRTLKENEHDFMFNFKNGEDKESIYYHCMRAINRSINFEYFPKIQGGDWNDGMNKVGIKGKGESVWLGFFLYEILIKFAEYSKIRYKICKQRNNHSNACIKEKCGCKKI